MTIAIVDYGAGNLRSVQNTLEELGAEYTVTQEASAVRNAGAVILPGVGHFGQMMRELDRLGLREALRGKARSGAPFLGICLGLQAMFEGSEEAPGADGLGLFPGQVRRFPAGLRCPHMGWNEIETVRPAPLLNDLGARPYLYFAHSYYCPVNGSTAATCTYGLPYTAVLADAMLFGVQFHPEKSGPVGLQIVRNFLEVCRAC
jgi:imidazole glycerol phosphate synthase glutamine amidotransferase subunit